MTKKPYHSELARQLGHRVRQKYPFSLYADRTGNCWWGHGIRTAAEEGSFAFFDTRWDACSRGDFYTHQVQGQARLADLAGEPRWTSPPETSPGTPPTDSREATTELQTRGALKLRVTGQPDHDAFTRLVEQTRRYMADGRFYLVNLTGGFTYSLPAAAFDFIEQLLLHSLSIKSGQFWRAAFDGRRLALTVSPELFLSLSGESILTEPVKGTLVPGQQNQDSLTALNTNTKEEAEQLMVTDLLRNDIGILCRHDSVRVERYKSTAQYTNVAHLSSLISGQLKEEFLLAGAPAVQVDRATAILQHLLPAGSISGMPRHEVTGYIRQQEGYNRDHYTGVTGILGFDATLSACIQIRTASINPEQGSLFYGAGGGITIDSNPEAEYREMLHKVKTVLGPFLPAVKEELLQ